MIRVATKTILTTALIATLGMGSLAFAGTSSPDSDNGDAHVTLQDMFETLVEEIRVTQSAHEGYSSVPELDAAGAPIALALVGGLAGIAMERRRRNKKRS